MCVCMYSTVCTYIHTALYVQYYSLTVVLKPMYSSKSRAVKLRGLVRISVKRIRTMGYLLTSPKKSRLRFCLPDHPPHPRRRNPERSQFKDQGREKSLVMSSYSFQNEKKSRLRLVPVFIYACGHTEISSENTNIYNIL